MAEKINLEAVQRTIGALRESERLPTESDGAVQMIESLAAAVDADPGNAALWREYRMALKQLEEMGRNDADGAEVLANALRAALRDEADR